VRHLLLAVGVIVAVVTPTVAAERPYISVRTGQAERVCADKPDREHPAPHWHAAVFFFDLMGQPRDASDTLLVTLHTGQGVLFDHVTGTVVFQFPAGLGEHTIRAAWRDPSRHERAFAEVVLSVYNCDP
jgi:hypothetical protein